MRSPTFDGVLFDVEGTLVDCVGMQLESWRRVLASAGFQFTHVDLQPYSGMDGNWMLERLLPQVPADTRQKLLGAQSELYTDEFLPRVQPFEGVRDLFEALKSLDMKIGIATTCQKDELAAYDRLLHILELTDAVVCGEMVKHGKPDPALVRTCLTQLSCSNGSRALMVGDTPYDAQAASPLGVLPAGLLTGGFSATDLRKAGCCAVFPQVKDLGALWNHIATPVLRTAS